MVIYNQIRELIVAHKVGQAERKQNNRIIIFQLTSTIHT